MKNLVLISTLFMWAPAFSYSAELFSGVKYPDEELKGFDANMIERLHKIRELVGRGHKCKVAIYGSFAKSFKLDRSKFAPAALEAFLPKSVTCIGDISIDPNTVHETTGCTLASFNSSNGEYARYFNPSFPTAMSKKACDSGGFEDLMAKRGWWSADAYKDSSVEETLFTPSSFAEPWQFVLVYAQSDRYAKWFADARKRGEVYISKKREPELKEQSAEKSAQVAREQQQRKVQAEEQAKKKERDELWK